jgi:uncharacterized membrane protein
LYSLKAESSLTSYLCSPYILFISIEFFRSLPSTTTLLKRDAKTEPKGGNFINPKEATSSMTRLDWIAQILMAALFLLLGLSRIVSLRRKTQALRTAPGGRTTEMPLGLSLIVGLLEIAGGLALIVPLNLWQPDILPRLAAAGLAVLTLSFCIYRARRKEPAASVVALFLLTLFVIIGRL